MRIILFLLLVFPAVVNAQFNRSATELAKETIREYLTGKIFKDQSYRPISYGEIKPRKQKDSDIAWSMIHKFEITEIQTQADKKINVQKPHQFIFFMDEKMKVLKAESFDSD
ncbi:MAG TPA: hypothetical protein VGQ09_19015 [Chitinophagaceae bacterium]|jgi:hypothetical protein|nr:hypothetical protein [Chitinophagaceae bacterium]